MLSQLLGYSCIAFGILWVVKPAVLRDWFVRKTAWRVFLFSWAVIIIVGFSDEFKAFGFLGFIVLVFAVLYFRKRVSRKLRDTYQIIPLKLFQVIGWLNIATGVLLVWGSGKQITV